MNCIGILCLKTKKYELAKYNFCLLYKSIKNNTNKIEVFYLNSVLYNISLCHFFLGEYEKCIKLLSKLKNVKSMCDYPYLYYRLALCYIEKSRNYYNIIKNKDNLVSKFIYKDNKLKGIILTNSEDEKKKITFEEDANDNSYIYEAIELLKQTLILVYNNISNKPEINDLNNLLNLNQLEEDDIFDKSDKQYSDRNYDYLLNSSIIYLLYCLNKVENYTEIEKYSTNYLSKFKSKIYIKTKKIIANYLVYAYLKLGKIKYALNLLMKQINLIEKRKENEECITICDSTYSIYSINKWKLVLYVNAIKINFFKGDIKEAKKYINIIFNLISLNMNNCENTEIPGFILNIIVYYLIITDNKQLAYYIIQHRKIPIEFFNL